MSRRSDCPVSLLLDIVGDKWSLLILRDMLFFNKKAYLEFLHSDEKMATNILSKRLEKLETEGLIAKRVDENDRRKKVYELTQMGRDMLPVMLEIMIWSHTHQQGCNVPETLISRAKSDRAGLLADLLARLS